MSAINNSINYRIADKSSIERKEYLKFLKNISKLSHECFLLSRCRCKKIGSLSIQWQTTKRIDVDRATNERTSKLVNNLDWRKWHGKEKLEGIENNRRDLPFFLLLLFQLTSLIRIISIILFGLTDVFHIDKDWSKHPRSERDFLDKFQINQQRARERERMRENPIGNEREYLKKKFRKLNKKTHEWILFMSCLLAFSSSTSTTIKIIDARRRRRKNRERRTRKREKEKRDRHIYISLYSSFSLEFPLFFLF